MRPLLRRLVVAIAALTCGFALPARADTAAPATAATVPAAPFADQEIMLRNGIAGKTVRFESGNPRSYEDIIAKAAFPALTLGAKLFVPAGAGPHAVVIIVPGSGGVRQPMLIHAAALTSAGIAVFVVDPFGPRGVTSTVADQSQFSFAASSYDVLAAARHLATLPDIDAARVGAMGYSRGGTAVLQAAVQPMAEAVLGPGRALAAVVAAWPWCGYQFEAPQTKPTAIRYLVADHDTWVSPIQAQAYAAAMQARNGEVSIRIVKDAVHGFGYEGLALQDVPDAYKALDAPIVYLDARGQFEDIWSGEPMPGANDASLTKQARPFITRGTRMGSKDDQASDFIQDAVGFFGRALSRPQ